jgi:hypothetical protein
MKSEVMQAKVLDFFEILDSKLWYNVELSNGIKSRIALTIEENIQGLGVKKGSIISVKTRTDRDANDPYFRVDFIKLIKS